MAPAATRRHRTRDLLARLRGRFAADPSHPQSPAGWVVHASVSAIAVLGAFTGGRRAGEPPLTGGAVALGLVSGRGEPEYGRSGMNRFERGVYDCMIPTAELLEQTTKPLHRAMLLNWWRHVHLEGSGQFERIVAADMMVDEPIYRVTWGLEPAVIRGKEGVLAFYNSVGDSVLWHSDDFLAVGDWGICDELTFHQLARGADLRAIGYDVPDEDKLFHVASRQAFVWPYDSEARLIGENLYEDKTSLEIEEVDPAEAITPARVREIHREQLAKLEAERGDRFWVLEVVAA
jgi:hypothetical protein